MTDQVAPSSPSQIIEISGLGIVRARPGLYVEALDHRGVASLVLAVLNYSFGDEAQCGGGASSAVVRLMPGNIIEVADNGVGLSEEPDRWGVPKIVSAFTALLAGPAACSELPAVNAFSDHMTVTSRHKGKAWRQEFIQTVPADSPEPLGHTDLTGVTVRFHPARNLFAGGIDAAVITDRVQSFINQHPGISVLIEDHRSSDGTRMSSSED